jgi:dethiobiotin synthetase
MSGEGPPRAARPPEGGGARSALRGGTFITGTDTGIGKTHVAAALLRALVAGGRRAVGMKPVAAGIGDDGRYADVTALRAAGNVDTSDDQVNPYRFAPAIAPHVAAALEGRAIDLARIARAYAALAARADVVVVEGAGGVLVPLGAREDMLDIPARLALPVVLVVGVRLGCISHALAAALAIRARGLVMAGWIANRVDPAMERPGDSVAALAERLGCAPAADLAFGATDVDAAALATLGFDAVVRGEAAATPASIGRSCDPC